MSDGLGIGRHLEQRQEVWCDHYALHLWALLQNVLVVKTDYSWFVRAPLEIKANRVVRPSGRPSKLEKPVRTEPRRHIAVAEGRCRKVLLCAVAKIREELNWANLKGFKNVPRYENSE